MSIEDLIKNYKTQRFSIEQSISREEDNLLKYQLKKDENAVNACRERLANLYDEIRRIDDKIYELENGTGNTFDAPIPAQPQLPNIDNVPIDDGTATVRFTMTNETEGTKGHGADKVKIHETETKTVERKVEVVDGIIVSETQTETTSKTTQKRKDEVIDINSKLLD